MSDSIAPQFKKMSELLVIINYEVSYERPCKTSLYNSAFNANFLWRILASFDKIRVKNNKTTWYGVGRGTEA
jgi:hypothetical protein